MSISSSIYAEYANKVKSEWLAELTDAITNNDMQAVIVVYEKMSKFYFSE